MGLLGQEEGSTSRWKWVGGMGVVAGILILSYYSVVAGWALRYFVQCLKWSGGTYVAHAAGEAQKLTASLGSRDLYGNTTWQDFGPIYADSPLTPDYISLAPGAEGDITGSFPWNAGKRSLLASSDIDGKVRTLPVRQRLDFAPAANGRNAGCNRSIEARR